MRSFPLTHFFTFAACRGMGRQGQLGIFNFVGFWGIGVVCGYYLAFHVGWGLEGLWTGILLGVVVTGCVCG